MVLHSNESSYFSTPLAVTAMSRFPGSQPISFGKKDLARLENEEYAGPAPSPLLPADLSVPLATGCVKSRMAYAC